MKYCIIDLNENDGYICIVDQEFRGQELFYWTLHPTNKYMRSHKYKCWVFQAFKKAWKAACSSPGSVLVVPKNKNYLLKPITFQGPCKSSITVQVRFHDRSHFLQRFKQLFLIHVYCIKWLMIFLRKKKKKTRYMELSRHLLIDPPTVTIWPTGLSLKMSKI